MTTRKVTAKDGAAAIAMLRKDLAPVPAVKAPEPIRTKAAKASPAKAKAVNTTCVASPTRMPHISERCTKPLAPGNHFLCVAHIKLLKTAKPKSAGSSPAATKAATLKVLASIAPKVPRPTQVAHPRVPQDMAQIAALIAPGVE